ncbi:BQ5605_C032g11097 [Microbotryum silenes-dioicae]|uniref:BQ5605_C032g11051 protein n=1 Tax=Microbotryum silenes-dioicae TaxID=796604 RepID=A0A2X0PID1_9BASI|nr:BQ5605_C032g11051 [Microbotryum silenes-dioicae]SGZ04907.1 BQ5605_C032g11097 [Microbotryum silenes-dioicae]
MSVQTPRPVRGPPRRHPSIDFRASPLRSASRASPATPAPNHSTKPTTVLGHWGPRLTQEDRRDSSESRNKIKVILGESLDEDSTPRPVQIEAIAALFELDQFGNRDRYDAVFVTAPTGSGKSVIFEAMYLIYGRRTVTIVFSPLNALSNHQSHASFRLPLSIERERKRLWYLRRPGETASCTGSWTTPITRSDLLHYDCMYRLTSCLTSALGPRIHWPGVQTVTQYGRTTVEDNIQRKGRGGGSLFWSLGGTHISTSGMHGDRPRLELLTENELSSLFFYESKACLHALAIVLYT